MTSAPQPPMALVIRALNVLSSLSDEQSGLTLQQLNQMLGIPLASLHRLLATLEATQFVSRSPRTKRYTLGPAARRLGATPAGQLGATPAGQLGLIPAPPPVSRAARQSTETVFTTRIFDARIICTTLVESIHHLRLFVRPGQEMPLHAAASARVILAQRDPELVERLLTDAPRDAFTRMTVREVNRIITQLAESRRRGFDVCDSELDPDVWAVAAPVFERDGRVESGVTIAAAGRRMESPTRRADVTLIVLRAARELSLAQGFTGQWPAIPSRDELARRFAAEPVGVRADDARGRAS